MSSEAVCYQANKTLLIWLEIKGLDYEEVGEKEICGDEKKVWGWRIVGMKGFEGMKECAGIKKICGDEKIWRDVWGWRKLWGWRNVRG